MQKKLELKEEDIKRYKEIINNQHEELLNNTSSPTSQVKTVEKTKSEIIFDTFSNKQWQDTDYYKGYMYGMVYMVYLLSTVTADKQTIDHEYLMILANKFFKDYDLAKDLLNEIDKSRKEDGK